MQWQFHFRQVDVSNALKEYAKENLERIESYLVKDSSWKVHFSMGKFDHEVEVVVTNPHGQFKAKSYSTVSLYAALDLVVEKLTKQFLKQKSKLQDHHKFDRSRQGKLKRVNNLLEFDNRPHREKKSA